MEKGLIKSASVLSVLSCRSYKKYTQKFKKLEPHNYKKAGKRLTEYCNTKDSLTC